MVGGHRESTGRQAGSRSSRAEEMPSVVHMSGRWKHITPEQDSEGPIAPYAQQLLVVAHLHTWLVHVVSADQRSR